MTIGAFLRGSSPRPNGWRPPPVRNPDGVDPALLTLVEWYDLVNPDERSHPDSAYNWDAERMRWIKRAEYPHLLRRLLLAGLSIEVRYKATPCRYVRRDAEGAAVQGSDGNIEELSDAEAAALGRRLVEYTFAAFDGDQAVALAADEWGCWLVAVAQEYRGIGLGTEMQRLAREHEPARPSGGFTSRGEAGLRRVHREMVRDALASGRYSRLVREGTLDPGRARAVLDSASLAAPRPTPDGRDLSPGGPADWFLRADGDGWFVVYSRKLPALIADGWDRNSYFFDRMILGAAGCHVLSPGRGGEEGRGRAIVVLFGGDSAPVQRLLMNLLASYCAEEGADLYVDPQDVEAVDGELLEVADPPNVATGRWRQRVRLRGAPIDWRPMAAAERRWRRTFDRYDEFRNHLMELAESKYRTSQ